MWRPCGAPVSPLEAPALSAGARRGGGRKDRLLGCSQNEQRWQPYERPVIRPQSAAMAACVAHGSQPLRCSLDAGVEAVLLAGCDIKWTNFAAPITMCVEAHPQTSQSLATQDSLGQGCGAGQRVGPGQASGVWQHSTYRTLPHSCLGLPWQGAGRHYGPRRECHRGPGLARFVVSSTRHQDLGRKSSLEKAR